MYNLIFSRLQKTKKKKKKKEITGSSDPFYHNHNHFLRNKYSQKRFWWRDGSDGDGWWLDKKKESWSNFYLLIMEWMFIVLLFVLERISPLFFLPYDSFYFSIVFCFCHCWSLRALSHTLMTFPRFIN